MTLHSNCFRQQTILTQSASAKKGKNPLDSLVESGTITEDQEKGYSRMHSKHRKMAYQTQAGAVNASNTFKNPLDSLVESGTITEDQETVVKKCVGFGKEGPQDAAATRHRSRVGIQIRYQLLSTVLVTAGDDYFGAKRYNSKRSAISLPVKSIPDRQRIRSSG